MKKRILSRLLAAFLAVMLMAQSLCLTAFAEETTLEATPEAVAETEPVNETVINEIEVEEPKVEEPVAEEPVAEEPVAEEPVVEEPVVEEPVAEGPVAEEPETKSEVIPVNIPADSDAATVNRILTKALLVENADPTLHGAPLRASKAKPADISRPPTPTLRWPITRTAFMMCVLPERRTHSLFISLPSRRARLP